MQLQGCLTKSNPQIAENHVCPLLNNSCKELGITIFFFSFKIQTENTTTYGTDIANWDLISEKNGNGNGCQPIDYTIVIPFCAKRRAMARKVKSGRGHNNLETWHLLVNGPCAGPYILGTRKSPQHIFCIILSRENKMPWEGEQGQRVMKRMII